MNKLFTLLVLLAAAGAVKAETSLLVNEPRSTVSTTLSSEQQSTVWIDVRSWVENKLDSIEGDPHIPHGDIVAGVTEQFPDKDTPIRLYCEAGVRAGKALEDLAAAGYTDIENAGGIGDVRKQRFAEPATTRPMPGEEMEPEPVP